MHYRELATFYNRAEYSILHKKNRMFPFIKSYGKKFAIVNSVRMIYLEEYR